ncbi:MAG: biopolymer transporter ExbD [Burkholderiaceae bacterium]|nr:biopolymer transporter ExbD [Burkholderiaceae bacterium]
MAGDIKADNQPYDDINVTPMLDLAYVLLVVFIILTTASVQGVKVNSPETQAANNLARPQTRAVTITADGQLFLDAYPVSAEQLQARLAEYRAANPALPVVLKGDAAAPYEVVMQVLDIAKRLDITELGLVTRRAPG